MKILQLGQAELKEQGGKGMRPRLSMLCELVLGCSILTASCMWPVGDEEGRRMELWYPATSRVGLKKTQQTESVQSTAECKILKSRWWWHSASCPAWEGSLWSLHTTAGLLS